MIPPVVRRFVAGETSDDALNHVREIRSRGIEASVNLLGEGYERREPADDDAERYESLVGKITEGSLGESVSISVKPTQLGLKAGEHVFRENLEHVIETARRNGVFVWVDMEEATTVDPTLDAFEHFVAGYKRMGITLQANLERTYDDIRRLTEIRGDVRLVKGAYRTTDGVYSEVKDVDEAYADHLSYLFENSNDRIGVATHDDEIINLADDLSTDYQTEFEVQMLMGVREERQHEVARENQLRQYVPYGDRWLSYFYRRMRDRKRHVSDSLNEILGE